MLKQFQSQYQQNIQGGGANQFISRPTIKNQAEILVLQQEQQQQQQQQKQINKSSNKVEQMILEIATLESNLNDSLNEDKEEEDQENICGFTLEEKEEMLRVFENRIKEGFFYQDLFNLNFSLAILNKKFRMISQEQKVKLINYLLDILYKTDKLKHAHPPIKIQQFKKQNAKRYNFKEKVESALQEDTQAQQLQERKALEKKGIIISESTQKKRRSNRPCIKKSLDVIQQNILKSQLKKN